MPNLLQIKIACIMFCVLVTTYLHADMKIDVGVSYRIANYSTEGINGYVECHIPPHIGPIAYFYFESKNGHSRFIPIERGPYSIMETNSSIWWNEKTALCYDSESIYNIEPSGWGNDLFISKIEVFPEFSSVNPEYCMIDNCVLSVDKKMAYLVLSEKKELYEEEDDDDGKALFSVIGYDIDKSDNKNPKIFKMELGNFTEDSDTSALINDSVLYTIIGDKIISVDVKERKIVSIDNIDAGTNIEAVFNNKIICSRANAIYCDGKVLFDNYKSINNYNNQFLWIIDRDNNVYTIDESLTVKKIGVFPAVSFCSSGFYNSNVLWIQENNDKTKLYTMDSEGKLSVSDLTLDYTEKKGFEFSIK